MTLQQAFTIGSVAKAQGFQVRAENGRAQIVSVVYSKNGKSTVTPKSDWMTFEQAVSFLSAA